MRVIEPLVSIIVPVYQAEPFLRKCLDSILAQSYTRMEIILIDDGSQDMSGSICEEYVQRDFRMRVIHQKNRGVSPARNAGIESATGQLVTFIDSDDWVAPEHIEILVRGIENCDCSICGYWVEEQKSSIERKAKKIEEFSADAAIERLLAPRGILGSVCNKMFRLSTIRGAKIQFREDVTYMEDMLFCASYFNLCKTLFCINQATYHYRQHAASTVGSLSVSMEWLQRRMTAFEALKGVRTVCHSAAAVRLCGAREQTECMEILLRLLKAGSMRDESKRLICRMRFGMWKVLRSPLPVKIKLKYFFAALWPEWYCGLRKWSGIKGGT